MHRLFVALRPPTRSAAPCLERWRTGPPGWLGNTRATPCHAALHRRASIGLWRRVASAIGTVHARRSRLALDGSAGSTRRLGALFARCGPAVRWQPSQELDRPCLSAPGSSPNGGPICRMSHLPGGEREQSTPQAGWSGGRSDHAAERVASISSYESTVGRHGSTYEAVASFRCGLIGAEKSI